MRLRQRLSEYYAGEGAIDPIRLELPRGGYAVTAAHARQEHAASATAAGAAAPTTATQLGPAAQHRARPLAWAAAGAVLIAALGLAALTWYAPAAEQPHAAELSSERAHRTRIAVVPLENLGGDAGLDRLAAGLTEQIMLRLDDLDLFVIATSPPRCSQTAISSRLNRAQPQALRFREVLLAPRSTLALPADV